MDLVRGSLGAVASWRLEGVFFGDLGESPSSLSREKLGLASLTARSDSTADAGNGTCNPATNVAGNFEPGG